MTARLPAALAVLAVALRRKEERTESKLGIFKRVHPAISMANSVMNSSGVGRALQDAECGPGCRAELRAGAFHDGAASVADVAKLARQVEAQVPHGRFANVRVAVVFAKPCQGQRRQESANGVVGRRFDPSARPVLVGQPPVGRQAKPAADQELDRGGESRVVSKPLQVERVDRRFARALTRCLG